ncbi:MAG TPA: hypothetical protein DIU47_01285 [Candidatus Pacebacteria bacterium]|nr:hypothetical protein [Candidatus Paceibacterota bacterium]
MCEDLLVVFVSFSTMMKKKLWQLLYKHSKIIPTQLSQKFLERFQNIEEKENHTEVRYGKEIYLR